MRGGIKVGRSCEFRWPGVYSGDVPAKIYFDARYDSTFTYER